jgi:hypothetical protein
VDQDILETIGDFLQEAQDRRIIVNLEEINIPQNAVSHAH